MKKIFAAGFIAWLSGSISVLVVSAIRFEIPSFQDVIGFGSYLLIATPVFIGALYLPVLYMFQKGSASQKHPFISPWLLAVVVNSPVYLFLWLYRGGYFSSETYLFTLGFFVVGFSFGMVYIWYTFTGAKKKWKILMPLIMLAVIAVFATLDYQFFYQDATYGRIRSIQNMSIKRSAHTATVLKNGKILIAGGMITAEGAEVNSSSAELFDPRTETFSPTGAMNHERAGHTATLLTDGNVLVTGGFDSNGFLSSAELYLLNTGKFVEINSEMSEKRAAHTATLLTGGNVLVLGGVNGSVKSNQLADIYVPSENSFKHIGNMHSPRTGHTSTLLKDGNVLIVGGSSSWRSEVLNSCEIFNPSDDSFTSCGMLNIPRNKHLSTLLPDGRVLIIGGSSTAAEIGGRYASVELFDPAKKQFSLLENAMMKARFKITNAGDVMSDGTVVIAGDGKWAEVYDPELNKFFTAKGNVSKAWMYPTVTAISKTRVLITGGYDANMQTTNGAWVYETAHKINPKAKAQSILKIRLAVYNEARNVK